jgi:hypothetical protein
LDQLALQHPELHPELNQLALQHPELHSELDQLSLQHPELHLDLGQVSFFYIHQVLSFSLASNFNNKVLIWGPLNWGLIGTFSSEKESMSFG